MEESILLCISSWSRAEECSRYLSDIYQFDYPGIGSILMYMAIQGVVVMWLIILIEVQGLPHLSFKTQFSIGMFPYLYVSKRPSNYAPVLYTCVWWSISLLQYSFFIPLARQMMLNLNKGRRNELLPLTSLAEVGHCMCTLSLLHKLWYVYCMHV